MAILIPPIELIPISDLHEDSQNPNVMTKRQLEALKENIQRFGFIIPVITNRDLLVADGAQRLSVAKSLGMDRVPVIRLDVSDVDRRILRMVLNKLRGEHDSKLDDEEFKRLLDAGGMVDLQLLLGNSDKMLVQFLANVRKPGLGEDNFDVGKALDAPRYSVAKGDLWQMGEHLLVCGDATDPKDYATLLGGIRADLVFTDPPYNVNYGGTKHPTWSKTWNNGNGASGAIINDNLAPEEWRAFVDAFLLRIAENLKGAVYVCMSCKEWPTLMSSFIATGFHWSATIIWVKDKFVLSRRDYHTQFEPILQGEVKADDEGEPILYGWPEGGTRFWTGGRKQADVWFIPRGTTNDLHPTMKPVGLVERAIANSSPPGGTVLDPFAGSGTTAIACEHLGRKARLIEMDARYCSVILERWEALTGQKAQLIKRREEVKEVA